VPRSLRPCDRRSACGNGAAPGRTGCRRSDPRGVDHLLALLDAAARTALATTRLCCASRSGVERGEETAAGAFNAARTASERWRGACSEAPCSKSLRCADGPSAQSCSFPCLRRVWRALTCVLHASRPNKTSRAKGELCVRERELEEAMGPRRAALRVPDDGPGPSVRLSTRCAPDGSWRALPIVSRSPLRCALLRAGI
jgi:hypothetical protein